MDSDSLEIQLSIKSSIHNYTVTFENFDLRGDSSLILLDSTVRSLYFPDLHGPLCVVESDEELKTLETVGNILTFMADHRMNKSHQLVVIGGGVLQDIGTLAASVYKRGIFWTFVPTTLQAMIDSCLGGKSSINLGVHKNLVGNFYPPNEVIIDISFLATLREVDLVCGLIEGAKICAASGEEELSAFLRIAEQLSVPFETSQTELWTELVHFALKNKQVFVENDEFDQGIRKKLNYGHTFGHAIESATGFQVPHGVAVGLGILMATNLSRSRGNSTGDKLPNFVRKLISPLVPNYVNCLQSISPTSLLEYLAQDKKVDGGGYTFVVPVSQGLNLINLPFGDSTDSDILKIVTSVLESWM